MERAHQNVHGDPGRAGQPSDGGDRSGLDRDPDRLLLGVLVESLEALIAAAEARFLEPAERGRDVALGVG